MDILAGGDGPMPDANTLRGVAEELQAGLPDSLTPDDLQLFLASEALERFEDPETTFALINAAITWRPSARAAAARVIAHMSANRALPPLLWSALNLPSGAERQAAADLLDRILGSEEALGMRAHHINSTELEPDQLNWLREIRDGGLAERDWMADPSLALPDWERRLQSCPTSSANLVGSTIRCPQQGAPISSRTPCGSCALSSTIRFRSKFRRGRPGSAFRSFVGRAIPSNFPSSCCFRPRREGFPPLISSFRRARATSSCLSWSWRPDSRCRSITSPCARAATRPRSRSCFELVPKVIGEQAIDIKFMSGTSTIGHCCVITHVTADRRIGEAVAVVLDPLEAEALQLQGSAQAVLRVKSVDGTLHWSLITPGQGLRSIGQSPNKIGTEEIGHWVEQQGPLIKEMLEQELSTDDQKAIQAQLSGLGNGLYKQVAPEALAGELDKLQENALVVVDSDADWVPWELLASSPTEALWGQRFVLVRAPVATRPPNATIAAPTALSKGLDRALIVAGDKVRKQKDLARLTFGGMAQRGEPPLIEGDWTKLLDAVRDKDVVHINCHGRSKPRYHLSFRDGIAGRLYPEQAHQLGLKWGTVVFANACSSAATQLHLADFAGFGREFYYAGARPFIGTLAPVPEDDAIEFARLFYEQFALAGLPAGHALRRAKEESAKRLKRPTWIFYCLYGNPSVVRRWSEA